MSVLKVLGAALAVTVLATTQVLALTITNRDTASYTVRIMKGDTESEFSLPAGEAVEDACEEGCVLRLADADDEHQAQDTDKFVIQDGVLQREQE